MVVKRIIFVGYYYPGDAASNFVVSFCKGYASLGIDVKLLLHVRNLNEVPQIKNVEIVPLTRMKRRDREKAVSKFIKDNYIEGESVLQYYGSPTYGWLPFKKTIPFFCTLGEIPFANPNMPWSFKIREWFQRLSTKKADGLLVLTNQLKDYYRNFGVKNIQVINILIDPSRFESLQKTAKERFISYCGSVGVYKDGVNDLIDAFSMIHTKHPNVKLQIIGGFFTPQDETVLREKVANLGLKDSIVFTGRVLPKQMPELLYNSEILALARPNNKQAQYGFPSKLGEYLFTGNPVVLTRVGEIDHFLTDKESCVFAHPDNPRDFADKLDWVLNHPEESKVIGLAGKKVAESNFSIISQCRVALEFFNRTTLSNS